MTVEKRSNLDVETKEDLSEDSNQEHQGSSVVEGQKVQSAAESVKSDTGSSSSIQQPEEISNAVAAAAATTDAYNKHLVAEVLLRYYKVKDLSAERQQRNQIIPSGNVHGSAPSDQEDFQVPAMPLPSHANTKNDLLTSASTSFDQYNRESSTTLFPTSSETSNGSKLEIVSVNSDDAQSTALDVLFGCRMGQRNNPGNVRLRQLCAIFHEEYKKGSRGQKTALTWRILHKIQSEGRRFLKFDSINKAWAEVSDHTAREKVAFTIRDMPYPLQDEWTP